MEVVTDISHEPRNASELREEFPLLEACLKVEAE